MAEQVEASMIGTQHMEKKKIERLILIYDADSGAKGAIVDSMKKVLMLKGCALCSITHGAFGEKREWKSCKDELGIPMEYLHRDELSPEMKSLVGEALPCILALVDGAPMVLVTPDVLERCKGSVADLRGRLRFYAGAHNLMLP
jgi:hypothetical protein